MWHKLLSSLTKTYLRQRVRRHSPRSLDTLEADKIRRILVISATALGDTLFSTPAIRALKQRYPDWELEVLLARGLNALLAHNHHVYRLWNYPGRGWRLLRLAYQLRRRRFDLVIILHGNDPEATLLACLTGAPYIIGSARSPLAFAYAAAVSPGEPYAHAIERRLDFVRLLNADTGAKRMDLFIPPEELRRAEVLLTRHFGAMPRLLLALHPTGSDPYKWWPAENFRALGEFLFRAYGAALLIISGAKDRPAAEALANRLPGPTLVTGGQFSLLTVAAALTKCRLLVANDSGPLHMGLALKVPAIALIGADDPRRIGPYGVEWGAYLHKREEVCQLEPCLLKKCPDNRCLKAIEVSAVKKLIREWWEPRFLSSRLPVAGCQKKP